MQQQSVSEKTNSSTPGKTSRRTTAAFPAPCHGSLRIQSGSRDSRKRPATSRSFMKACTMFAIIPELAASSSGFQSPSVEWRFARALGRRHSGRRLDEFQRQAEIRRVCTIRRLSSRQHARDRTIPQSGREHARLHCHRGGSDHLDQAFHLRVPWRADDPTYRGPDDLFEYACHEGNYRMIENSITAAKAVRAAQSKKK